jgi:hypothetical protein
MKTFSFSFLVLEHPRRISKIESITFPPSLWLGGELNVLTQVHTLNVR